MNENHAKLCPSPEWAEYIQEMLLPSLLDGVDLGNEMLEVGPGPGAATEYLRRRVAGLTALEVDETAARDLQARYEGTNVEVVLGDAASMKFSQASFDSTGCFTMLHHIPTLELQAEVLSEMSRVLRPGGVLVGSDSLASDDLLAFHEDDTYNPVDPSWLLSRLRALGFEKITLAVGTELRFVACKPSPPAEPAPALGDRVLPGVDR